MPKFLGFIVGAITLGIGIVTKNPALIAAGAAQLAGATVNLLFGPKAPKPQASETQAKNPAAPRVYGYGTRRVYGSLAFWGNNFFGSTVDVIAFVDGRAHAVRQAYLNDDKITVSGGTVNPIGKKYGNGRVKAGWNLGQTPAPVHTAVTNALGFGNWGANHRGDGVVSGYVIKAPEKEDDYLDTYPQGDNATLSLVIDLQLCFDPRNPAHDINDDSTWEWTENPVLQLLHYFVVRLGYSYENKILPQIDKWIAAADVCDEVISGEARYRSCVLYDSTAKPAEVIGSFLETFDGWYAENEFGEIVIYAGEYYSPTVSIGPDDIIEYQHQAYVEEENIYNEISVKYISSLHDYNEVEAQPWRDETDISARGIVNSLSIAPQVPSFKQGRRLAKISMARNNTPDRGTIVTNYMGRKAEGDRFINLLIEEAGAVIFDGVAEVTRVTRNLETQGLTIEWTRAEPAAWSWNPATEDGYGAPTGTFPTITPPDPPVIDSVIYAFDNDANTAALTINGTGPDRDDLTWYARVREQGTSAWEERRYDDAAPGASVELKVNVVPVNTALEVQIGFSTGNGKFSGWSDSEIVSADTNATPPDDAVAITLVSWSDILSLSTDRIARASSYRWRIYASDGTTLIRTVITGTPSLDYTNTQASIDGPRRAYIVDVAGINSAGAGGIAVTPTLTLPAPPAVTNVTATENPVGNGEITFDEQTGVAGYSIATATATSFDPMTQGFITIGYASPAYIQNLAVNTYYTKVAAFDGWTDQPDLLNYSAEATFTTTGTSGGVGGGGGDGGGGYCPQVDTLILMANDERTGPGDYKRAGDIVAGDWVWTVPELDGEKLGEWAAYEVEAASIHDALLWTADIGIVPQCGSGPHRIWIAGWTRLDEIGVVGDMGQVAKLTVNDAHTYVGNGLLHHNAKNTNDPSP